MKRIISLLTAALLTLTLTAPVSAAVSTNDKYFWTQNYNVLQQGDYGTVYGLSMMKSACAPTSLANAIRYYSSGMGKYRPVDPEAVFKMVIEKNLFYSGVGTNVGGMLSNISIQNAFGFSVEAVNSNVKEGNERYDYKTIAGGKNKALNLLKTGAVFLVSARNSFYYNNSGYSGDHVVAIGGYSSSDNKVLILDSANNKYKHHYNGSSLKWPNAISFDELWNNISCMYHVTPFLKPSAPTGLFVTRASDTSAKVSWNAVSGASSYEVEYYNRNNQSWKTDLDYKTKTVASYTAMGLVLYDSYQFRVRALNAVGASAWSQVYTYYKLSEATSANVTPPVQTQVTAASATQTASAQVTAVPAAQTASAQVTAVPATQTVSAQVTAVPAAQTTSAQVVAASTASIPSVFIDPTSDWAVSVSGGSKTYKLKVGAWTIQNESSIPSWISVKKTTDSATLTVSANNTSAARSYVLAFYAGNVRNAITITQSALTQLTAVPATQPVSTQLTAVPATQPVSTQLTAVPATQAAPAQVVTASTASIPPIFIDPTYDWKASASGGSKTYKLKVSAWTIQNESSIPSWLSVKKTADSATLTVSANNTGVSRSYVLAFYAGSVRNAITITQFTNASAVSSKAQIIVNTAKSWLGSSYYYGLCQAFVWRCYSAAGSTTSANSATEAGNKWIISTSKDNIPIGAAVYFKATNPNGHVGIYIGNGQVIHAQTTVKQESLSSLCSRYTYRGWGYNGGKIPD